MTSKLLPSPPPEKITFPCLMRNRGNGAVVIFTSLRKGTVVHPGSGPYSCESPFLFPCTNTSEWAPFSFSADKVEEEAEYPRIMRAVPTGVVVLFTAPNQGTVLHAGSTSHKIGHHGYNQFVVDDREIWKPFTGIVQLSN